MLQSLNKEMGCVCDSNCEMRIRISHLPKAIGKSFFLKSMSDLAIIFFVYHQFTNTKKIVKQSELVISELLTYLKYEISENT